MLIDLIIQLTQILFCFPNFEDYCSEFNYLFSTILGYWKSVEYDCEKLPLYLIFYTKLFKILKTSSRYESMKIIFAILITSLKFII